MKACNSRHLTLIEVVLFGVLGGMMFALKVAMSGLPNIEPVSLLVMVYAVVFGWKCLYPIYVYVLMEILLFGIGTWNLNYLYIWAILAFGAISLRQMKNPLAWAVLSGAYGLLFGLFCAPVDVFVIKMECGTLPFTDTAPIPEWVMRAVRSALHTERTCVI